MKNQSQRQALRTLASMVSLTQAYHPTLPDREVRDVIVGMMRILSDAARAARGALTPSAGHRLLAHTQSETIWMLDALVSGKSFRYTYSTRDVFGDWKTGKWQQIETGSLCDLWIARLFELVDRVAIDKIRQCPDPDCGRYFVKVTRKRYCSTRCQRRVYMRQLRATARAERAREISTRRRRVTRGSRKR
jgi:hypothetical protein